MYTLSGHRICYNGEYIGRTVSLGGYIDSNGDNIKGWYIDTDDQPLRRFGPGYGTLRDLIGVLNELDR